MSAMATLLKTKEAAARRYMEVAALLTTREAARYLSVSPRTLERLRLEGSGPRYCKIKRSVRYRILDLDAYLDRNAVFSTSEARRFG
jgi:excisionase family DNA binding protein